MGYKLAGYETLGFCEIDERMAECYRANLTIGGLPRYSYQMPIQDFKALKKMPKELFELDVLDGSPPCSSFSMAGNREMDWGKKKKFREGQASQILDDLFFHFIDLANRLRPRIVVAENVKGMMLGNARGYVKAVFEKFRESGYDVQLFLLNSAFMGVPQKRERVFFIARRQDLGIPKLSMSFSEKQITVEEALAGTTPAGSKKLPPGSIQWWKKTPPGKSFSKAHPKGSYFNWFKLHPRMVSPTIPADSAKIARWDEPRSLSQSEMVRIQTFPDDYKFCKQTHFYVCGMSVPPLMMQRVSLAIAKGLLP